MSKKPDPQAPRIDPLATVAIPAPDALPAPTLRGKELASEASPASPSVSPAPEPTLGAVGTLTPAPRRAPRYEVLRPITLSWGAGFIRLAAGDEVSDETHGDGAVERMRSGGTALREL